MSPARSGFWAGLVAGSFSVTAIYLGWFTGRVPAVALALWERQMRLIPLQLFSFLIVRLKFAAKPAAFWGMLAVMVVLFGLIGAGVARWARRRPGRLLAGAWLVVTGFLAFFALRPASRYLAERLAAEGGVESRYTVPLALVGYAVLFAIPYTMLVLALTRRPAAGGPPSGGVTRRELLSRVITMVIAAATGGAAAQWLATSMRRATATAQSMFSRISGLPPEITPNDQFYVVSKNPPGFDPVVNVSKWSLEVGGLVAKPVRLTYDELRAMPAVEQFQTLECISNEVGGDLISTAKWKGVRLRDVLMQAGGAATTAVKVAFRCADGYSESIPLIDAMQPTTLLALEMNGDTLLPRHGFPVRLLVPGLFGMKNPKWMTKVEVVDYDFRGYWEGSGWSDDAVVKTMSEFTGAPHSGGLSAMELGGVAYAGDRGIKDVEYSSDSGKTWQPAEVKPPLGKFTWVLWAAVWTPTAPGEYTLKVRARDALGVLQTAQETRTLPDGASGYHTIRIRVRK
jgi:DMSO/TMAO reductase YedYZ molybdopterin-dependent catalytic subunit